MRKLRTRLIWVFLSLALLALGLFLRCQLKIDDCLDGGGRWNYETSTCDDDAL